MISEGSVAPRFTLPALVDGERRQVTLGEFLGDDVVILAFYPGDFNPACDETACDLDELDLFTMQKDVTILGISPDSVYSHQAFADTYSLNVPLLSDTAGGVAQQYGIGMVDDIGQHLLERAVVVIDHDGIIQYTWSTDSMTQLPRVDEIKDAIADTGGDDTAFARYRVGHAHYTEGRRAFTSAMAGFQDSEWMMAQNDFRQARSEFSEAEDRFDTAVRFVDDETLATIYGDARTKASALWQAADWLSEAASAYASGSGSEGQELRDDADRPLSEARGYAEPPDPDGEWPPAMETLVKDDIDDHSILPSDPEPEDTGLSVDIDAEVDRIDEATKSAVEEQSVESDGEDTTDRESSQADEDIDDEDLAELEAELAANSPTTDEPEPEREESTAVVEGPPAGGEEGNRDDETTDGDDEAAEIELTDPNADADDDE